MTRRALGVASLLLVLAMAATGLLVGLALPEGAELPVHWGLDGEPDRLAGKWPALLLPVALVACVSALFYAMPSLEPKAEGLARSRGLYLASWLAMLLIFGTVDLALISHALGWSLNATQLIAAGVGLGLILIGNQLGKSRRMFLLGVRTPWTLASEEVWIRTHRLAGWLMVASGALITTVALVSAPSGLLVGTVGAAVAAMAVIPIVYSYMRWRREKRSGQPSE